MPTWWQQSLALLRAPANEVAFAVRSRVRWRRGVPVLRNEDKSDLFAALPSAERQQANRRLSALSAQFDLAALAARSTRIVLLENVALLDRLSALAAAEPVPAGEDGTVRAVDVGSGDFHYATALQRWLARHRAAEPRRVVLRGLEVDGFCIYRDGHARADHARAHAALAEPAGSTVRYEVADFRRVRLPEQDVVTMFYPFLSAYPLLRWGAPLSLLRPQSLVLRAVATVRPGGLLVVGNQTETEFERLQALLADQPVQFLRRTSFATNLAPAPERTAARVGSLWRRLPARS